MEFIDLAAQQRRIFGSLDERIKSVLSHGQYILGPEVKELEAMLASYVGVKHAVGCASGTDALLMALMAYDVKPGDAILTTPFTFIAAAEVISLLGATPVFVDIDPRTFNIAPDALVEAISALRSANQRSYPLPRNSGDGKLVPRGIVAVDLFGLPADYKTINQVARQHGLFVIEDAAQSFGAELGGCKACSLTDVGCTSFFPAKPLGCYGDGGMCFTNDDKLAESVRSISVHGKGWHKYDNVRIGINGRLDTLQAAILLAKFEVFREEIEARQDVAIRYTKLLAGMDSFLTPRVPQGMKSAWAQYSLLASGEEHRSELQKRLNQAEIPHAVYYPKSLHLQDAFRHLGYREGDFPISEDVSRRIFSVPMHPYLSAEDQQRVARALTG